MDYNFNILNITPSNTIYCENGSIDKAKFFQEATLILCGTLNLEEAFSSFFVYLQQLMSVNNITVTQMEFDIKQMKYLVSCDENSTLLFHRQIQFSEADFKEAEKIFGRPTNDETKNLIGKKLFSKDMQSEFAQFLSSTNYTQKKPPVFFMRIRSDYNFYVGVFFHFQANQEVSSEHLELLYSLRTPLLMALRNGMHYQELLDFKTAIAKENINLKAQLNHNIDKKIIGTKSGLAKVIEEASLAAYTNVPVLIQGETGVGKELIAEIIHNFSKRKAKDFVAVNCGAIPLSLIDSELFGHAKGAFTGAIKDHKGYFEQAQGGTLFFDEIGELPLAVQSRLLRVLQEKTIRRIGSTSQIELDFRLIVATHRNLRAMVTDGTFREDLYYRLKVVQILVPPLRERKEDIPLLVTKFLQEETKGLGILVPQIPSSEIDKLKAHDWYGNIRELKNVVLEALALNPQGPLHFRLEQEDSPIAVQEKLDIIPSYRDMETKYFKELLASCQGRISGPFGAAAKAGIKANTLRFRLDKCNIPYGRKLSKRT